jgi:TetR/AcrR family transcriptional repressor of nem operon
MAVSPATEQGRITRERILQAAAQLIAVKGAAATSVDDVLAATRASKSQLYHYFGDKHGLIEAVVDYQSAAVLGFQARLLAGVRSWEDLERWADATVDAFERQGSRGGCPLGTLAAALADTDQPIREQLSEAFRTWGHAISGALIRLRDNGLLARNSDIEKLTTTMLAAIQGGLLLGKTTRDSAQLRIALEGAIANARASAPAANRRTTAGRRIKQRQRSPR